MQAVPSFEEAAAHLASAAAPVVTVGTFDGVHRGHLAILHDLVAWGKQAGGPVVVITFKHHPRRILEGASPDMITTVEHRLLLFEREGIDLTVVVDFSRELSQVSAEEFLSAHLVGMLKARGLQLGFDSRFGHGGRGDAELARRVGEPLGLEVRVSEPVLGEDGTPISSTAIREAIWDGDLARAEGLLGRRVSALGTVVPGAARGRRMGYRTANLDLHREVRPPYGVYATVSQVDGRCFHSVTNVGSRPTAEDPSDGERPDLLIETHLFDFDEDLYGQQIEVIFVKKLRDERRFPSIDVLVEQIRRDESSARQLLLELCPEPPAAQET